MAKMFVTLKIMPESTEVDLNLIRQKIKVIVTKYGGDLLNKDELEPIAFGLNALKLIFIIDESKGSDEISDEVSQIEGVSSSSVIDMRRAIG